MKFNISAAYKFFKELKDNKSDVYKTNIELSDVEIAVEQLVKRELIHITFKEDSTSEGKIEL